MKKLWQIIKNYAVMSWTNIKTLLPDKQFFKDEFTVMRWHWAMCILWTIRLTYLAWLATGLIGTIAYNVPVTVGDYGFAMGIGIMWYVFYILMDVMDQHDAKFWKDLFFKSQELVHMYAKQQDEIIKKLEEAVEEVNKNEIH